MSFASAEFFIFLAVLLLLYYVLPKKMQWVLLAIGSAFFYMYADKVSIVFIAYSVLVAYLVGLSNSQNLARQEKYLQEEKFLSPENIKAYKKSCEKVRKEVLGLGIVFVLGMLILLKGTVNIKGMSVLVPLGISFYTLEVIGYMVDASKGRVPSEKNPFKLFLVFSFFPKIVQGPICRYTDIKDGFFEPHDFDLTRFKSGTLRIAYGFFKKLVFADRLAPAVSLMMEDAKGWWAVLGMILYSFRLYADFSGGIDIALGVAELFGITLPENFDTPYFSSSLKEFWRRWHISMCVWFKTYVFYPVSTAHWMQKLTKSCKKVLGNNAGRKVPLYLGSLIVWSLTGIWHGIGMNYWVWGVCNWAVLMFDEEMEPLINKLKASPDTLIARFIIGRAGHVFAVLKTFLLVAVLNYFDSSVTLLGTFEHFGRFFTASFIDKAALTGLLSGKEIIVLALAFLTVIVFSCVQVYCKRKVGGGKTVSEPCIWKSFATGSSACYVLVLTLLILSTVVLGAYGIGYDAAGFIYNGY